MKTLLMIHGLTAYLSLSLLLIRGVMSVKGKDWRAYKLLKIAPHAVDTLLLVTGFAFVGILLANEYVELAQLSWVLPKLAFIVLYVIFSAKAFKKNQPFSLKHFLLAVVSFMLAIFTAVLH
ncbi:invasion protein expression up-regulator SirB [Pasteurellaceae bacterium RH1A]|nr:invasion protein expression up-regulator SirB [Pasteurellaceae bacterium RH1A]